MKKIILSAASLAVAAVASVSVAPTTSEAIPAFARQTGSACLACHFQSFPTLGSYGRAFKMNAFTDVGDQGLIEDDHLSLPNVLNMSIVFRPNLVSTDTTVAGVTTTAETLDVPADPVILIGGRAGENTGFFVEIDTTGGGFANTQLLNQYDMGDLKVGWSYFNSGFGEDAGMQLMSVWGQHGGLMGGKGLSINQVMSKTNGDVAGFSAQIGNETWMASLGLIDPTANRGTTLSLAPVVRANYFLDVADFELGFGVIAVSGSTGGSNAIPTIDAKRTGIDFQAQGEMNDMQVGVYADWATAPAGSVTVANGYNASTVDDRTGYSFRATLKPTHNIVLLAGVGQDKTGAVTIDKTLVGFEYEVYQNFVVAVTQSSDDDGTTKNDTTLIDIELLL
ncbi:MAG TPA: hypothetical protein EYG66_06320 [Mariprofundaceae bacterium]|nr:hypothetical protein [Mariprofundaceae bacterium]